MAQVTRRGHDRVSATIEWYGVSPKMPDEARVGQACERLWDNEEDCELPVVAIVTDEVELIDNRHMCDLHLRLYMEDLFGVPV